MQFGVLGTLLARVDGQAVPLNGPRQAKLLAALLVRANQVVSLQRLVEVMWDGNLPATAVRQVQDAVSGVRRNLAAHGAADVISTERGGYRIHLETAQLDLLAFEHERRLAQQEQRSGDAVAGLRRALACWRGPALADLTGSVLEDEASRLNALRTSVHKQCLALELALGRHHEVVDELTALLREHPLDEELAAQAMLALYRAGRQAEALTLYQQIRRELAEELGTDPTPPLQELHRRILNSDPELSCDRSDRDERATDQSSHRSVPRQLPAGVAYFTGRAREIDDLLRLAHSATPGSGAIVISAIGGAAGIGKTGLAVHFAHQIAPQFPDAQLYVNLRGFAAEGTLPSTTTVVRGFLDALGVPTDRIPCDLDAQLALYRSRMANTRSLILLDNARDAEQVRPLLPGEPGCLVLVTSRDQLLSLVALDGAVPIVLDVLSRNEAIELLTRRLGAERLRGQTQAVNELVDLCARLPLALNIAAARALSQPGTPLSVWVEQLRDAQGRLALLSAGAGAADVRTVFSWSYKALGARAARMFRLLGLHPGPNPEISVLAAASLADLTTGEARYTLNELSRAHLITTVAPDRYTFHDLLRTYATELTHDCDADDARRDATGRMLRYYTSTALAAANVLYPHAPVSLPDLPSPSGDPVKFDGFPRSRAWMDLESTNLVSCSIHAESSGWPAYSAHMSGILYRYLLSTERHADAANLHLSAFRAATALNDKSSQARALVNLGVAKYHLHDYPGAIRQYLAALDLSADVDDTAEASRAHANLGGAYTQLGRYDEAINHYTKALAAFEQLDQPFGKVAALFNLAVAHECQENYPDALGLLHQCLHLARQIGDRANESRSLNYIGRIQTCLGNTDAARGSFLEGLGLARELDETGLVGPSLRGLGTLARNSNPDESLSYLQEALAIAIDIDDIYELASTHMEIGDTHDTLGDQVRAQHHWQEALSRFIELGVPDADSARSRLDNKFTQTTTGNS
ncbi:BTAD domain-containing putative transcriptional regulator [Kitasatospora sp. NPDC002227]|uniref:AfsR/SARP family transcriptional regulator n=1 Tax=Kitasatospora sp. NPDC002227 TaxID=3154773 RepID=UPI00332676EF